MDWASLGDLELWNFKFHADRLCYILEFHMLNSMSYQAHLCKTRSLLFQGGR